MYKLHLILKYLRGRRIAWVSLGAVMLCTTMVIVVISVMGGWLTMYENSARGMTGDIVIKSAGLSGFPHYEEMVQKLEAQPYVKAAVPEIHVPGVATFYVDPTHAAKTDGVQVFGIQIDKIGEVNKWPDSLYLQHDARLQNGLPLTTPSFDTKRSYAELEFDSLPEEAPDLPYALAKNALPWLPWQNRIIPGPIWRRIRLIRLPYRNSDGTEKLRMVLYPERGSQYVTINDEDIACLDSLSSDRKWIAKVRTLASLVNRKGVIAGARLIDIRRDRDGKIVGRESWKYELLWVKLTVLGIGTSEQVRLEQKGEPEFWVIDDSRTGMWQYDNNAVYVDFTYIQNQLNMGPQYKDPPKGTFRSWLGMREMDPPRTTEVNVRLQPGTDANTARDKIDRIVQGILDKYPDSDRAERRPHVDTWRQASQTYLEAIEHEKVLVVLLFGIISLVAVFLIFCIFYMIVAEKTKDIGIIKSAGATNLGVFGIFLGYGLVIGIVGAGLGLMLSYLVVHNINEIHDFMGRRLGMVVWNPEVYAFEKIPNTMDPNVWIILLVAVFASVLGAYVPARQAARKHPVEALRWE